MQTVSYDYTGLRVTEYRFEAPLDHAAPGGETIDLFARSVVTMAKKSESQPWLLYFMGGPGFEAPRPQGAHTPPWLGRASEDYRVIFLDQRGMGRSSPIGPRDALASSPEALAERLTLYRADSIIRDAERLRVALGIEKWSVLGQSFGGFCTLAYLSAFPEALNEALITGGLPPLDQSIDAVYEKTYRTLIEKTGRYYRRFPEDRDRVLKLIDAATAGNIVLPCGDVVSPSRVRQLGQWLGMGGGPEQLHYLLELPVTSPGFLHDFERMSPFARNPLYAVIHESCYADDATTNWAALRMLPTDYQSDPALLTGEHIFPWMFDEIGGLAPFREAAHILAGRHWGPLYDPDILSRNEVPSAAAIYVDDMYVPRAYSEETAARVKGLRAWITNEHEHDGLSAAGGATLDRLIKLARDEI